MSLPSFAGVLGKPHKVESVGDSAMGVSLQGDTLCCIADDSLYALDVSAPLSPKLLGSLNGMDNRRQVVAWGNFVYGAVFGLCRWTASSLSLWTRANLRRIAGSGDAAPPDELCAEMKPIGK